MEETKEFGGLGFGNLKIKNLGLLVKWWWKYSTDVGSLWKKVVKYTNAHISDKASMRSFSSVKHGTLREVVNAASKFPWLHTLISDNLSLVVRVGNTIMFWSECWIGHFPLSNKFPMLFFISLQQDHLINLAFGMEKLASGPLHGGETYFSGK